MGLKWAKAIDCFLFFTKNLCGYFFQTVNTFFSPFTQKAKKKVGFFGVSPPPHLESFSSTVDGDGNELLSAPVWRQVQNSLIRNVKCTCISQWFAGKLPKRLISLHLSQIREYNYGGLTEYAVDLWREDE